MLFGELASRSGLSRDTIRFYEKQGLIQIKRKERRENNYKEYSQQTLQTLLVIKRLKGFGFTLHESLEFLALIDGNQASCDHVSEKVQEKALDIDRKITGLQELKSLLTKTVGDCVACCAPANPKGNCPILIPDKF